MTGYQYTGKSSFVLFPTCSIKIWTRFYWVFFCFSICLFLLFVCLFVCFAVMRSAARDWFINPYTSVFLHCLWDNHVIYSPIYVSISSLSLGQSCDCPGDSDEILKNMGTVGRYLTTIKHSKARTVCMIIGTYSVPVFHRRIIQRAERIYLYLPISFVLQHDDPGSDSI